MLQVSNAIVSIYWVLTVIYVPWYYCTASGKTHVATCFSSFLSSSHCNSLCFVVAVNILAE
jgi:hypothetical protein